MSTPQQAIGDAPLKMLANDEEIFAMDFAARLSTGETLQSPPTITITYAVGGAPAGSEISVSSASISGSQVVATYRTVGATPGTQYYVDIICPTSLRTHGPEGKRRLVVIGEG